MLDHITPVLLTYNEAPNIARTLSHLEWAKDIVVVDSGSTDDTVAMLGRASKVRVFGRPLDTLANQWRYAVTDTAIATPWILRLDADSAPPSCTLLCLACTFVRFPQTDLRHKRAKSVSPNVAVVRDWEADSRAKHEARLFPQATFPRAPVLRPGRSLVDSSTGHRCLARLQTTCQITYILPAVCPASGAKTLSERSR